MVIGQCLSPDDIVEVGAHQMGDEVEFVEVFKGVVWREDVQHGDHVLMAKVFE